MAALIEAHEDRIVQAAGMATQLRRGGKGAPLLVLHGELGLPGWAEYLQCLAGERDVIAPSLPGYGASERPDWIMSVHDLAAWVSWFLRDMKIATPIDVVGLSMGGWIAAELAVANPGLFRRLVLAAPMGVKPAEGEIFDYFLEGGMTGIRRNFADAAASPEFNKYWGGELSADQTDAIEWHRETTCRIVWRPYMHSLTLPHFLPAITTPTLILQGGTDSVTPPDCGRLYHQGIAGSKLQTLSGCGHAMELEQPRAFADAVLSFLK